MAETRADIIPGSQRNVQGWTLDAHDLPGKGFSHCTIFARYRSGIMMIFSLNAQRHWNVGWLYPSWALRLGQPIHLRYSIDGSPPAELAAAAKNKTLVAAELPADASLFAAMRQGRQMTLYAPGGQLGFSLDGTSAALAELNACVDRFVHPGSEPTPAVPPTPGPQVSAQQGKGAAKPTEGLPLKPGFYVNADTPCGNASFATLWNVDPTGVNIGHQSGTFTKIEKVGADRYRVTQAVGDPRNGGPSDSSTETYTVTSPTSFRFGEGADTTAVRYCPSSSLPEPWRRR